MLKELRTLDVHDHIVTFSYAKNQIHMIGQHYTRYTFDSDYQVLSQQKLLKDIPPMHHFSHAPSIAPDHSQLIIPYHTNALALVISTDPKPRLQHKIDTPLKTVECSAYSSQKNYFAIGDEAGRVSVFDAKSANFLTSLTPRPDYINALIFSENERFLLSCAFDKSVIIIDLVLNTEIATFSTSDVVETALFFNNNCSVALFERNGAILIYDLDELKIESEKNILVSWPTSSLLYWDAKHFIVSMKNGQICAIDIDTLEIIFSERINQKGVAALLLHNKHLIVSPVGMPPMVIDTVFELNNFNQALSSHNHEAVSKILTKNSFLMLIEGYDDEMESFYTPLFSAIYALIEKGDKAGAQKLVASHNNDPKLLNYFQLISNAEQNIKALKRFIETKAYANAFSLIEKYSYLRTSPAGVRLERLWNKSFIHAKTLCLSNQASAIKEAKTALLPFTKVVSKQQLIHSLFSDATLFSKADNLLQNKRFKEYFELCEQKAFLKEQASYNKVLQMGEHYLGQLKSATSLNDFSRAKELLKLLTPFIPLQKQINQLKNQLVIRLSFFNAINNKEISKVYELAKEYPYLRQFDVYKKVESTFKEVMNEAINHAFKADGQAITTLFEPYQNVPLFKEKIASVRKISYLNEMKQKAKTATNWKKVFTDYLALFGRDDEIIHTAKVIGQSSLLASMSPTSDPDGYKKRALPDYLI